MESQVHEAAVSDDKPADFIRNPYPYFAQKRTDAGVFHGTVVDYSKTPESLRPKNSFAAMSFEAVNTAFRDAQVFSSTYYDNTIGLFIGPSILAMAGKTHRDHRNLVSAAFKSKALARWEPEIVRPICDALIDEFDHNMFPTMKIRWTAYPDLPNAVHDQLRRLHDTFPSAWALLATEPNTSRWVEELGRKGYYVAPPGTTQAQHIQNYTRAWASNRAELGSLAIV